MASTSPPAARRPRKTAAKGKRAHPVDPGRYSRDSFLIHGRRKTKHWDFSHHVVPPISSSSTFRLESHDRGESGFCGFADPEATEYTKSHIFIYERLDEPVRAMLEERLAAAEGAEMSVCFASGMAAIAAALTSPLQAGDEIVAHPTLYGCTYSLLTTWLPRLGMKVRYHDLAEDLAGLRFRARTRILYCESPANPTMQILDLEAIAAAVKKANRRRSPEERIRLVVDNTFATPACQRPLELGADVVCGSLTKGIGGFGTDMGGYVAAGKQEEGALLLFRKDFGAPLSPLPSWRILSYGLPTLSLRTRRAEETATELAGFLAGHPGISRVQYPGHPSSKGYEIARRQMRDFQGRFAPGTLIYFELKGRGRAAAQAADKLVDFIGKRAYAITLAVSLGQIRTLIERPGGMTHSSLPKEVARTCGIGAGGVRLAVGIEDPVDIRLDLENALKAV
ncbi:MAG: trans-sulfuration enzyme family protein [Planctomycetota bacterium]